MVGELVEDDVQSVARVAAAFEHRVPRQHDRSVIPRLPQCPDRQVDDAVRPPPSLRRAKTRRVNQDRHDAGEVVVLDSQKQHRGLGGDGHLDLIGHGKPAAPLPVLLGDEYSQVVAEVGVLALVQPRVERDIPLQVPVPLIRGTAPARNLARRRRASHEKSILSPARSAAEWPPLAESSPSTSFGRNRALYSSDRHPST